MEDLFAGEQKIYEEAESYARELLGGMQFDPAKYGELAREYGRLLRQLRRATKISDRATGSLNASRVDLQGKVNHDGLTGIFNRRYMDDNLQRVVKSLSRSGGYLSVLMIDIDFFKKYNDTYGHSQGDICLITVAKTIAGCISRPDDFAVRYGGEEFAVILPGTDAHGAGILAGKILEAVRACNIPHEKNEATGYVTVSIGGTSSLVLHEHTGNDFIKCADAALYQSKEGGRNRYTYTDLLTESRK